MTPIELLKTRKSIRKYDDRPIETSILQDLVDCGRLAATGKNQQPWHFVIITDSEKIKKMQSIIEFGSPLKTAAAAIAVFCEPTEFYVEDGCAATQNILLAAHAHGLGSCWMAGYNRPYANEIEKLLNAPEKFKLISVVSLGYCSKLVGRVNKRDLNSVLHINSF